MGLLLMLPSFHMSSTWFQKFQGCCDLARRGSTPLGPSFLQVRHVTSQRLLEVLMCGTGTVSGAPKVRAMELIAELEREKRGVYAGAVGYFGYSSVDGDKETEGAMNVSLS
jgi:hypothetical protein